VSQLRQAAEDYLGMRRALGFKLETQGQLLIGFIGYLERERASTVTTELSLAWARQPAHADPVWWNRKLSVVRGFARHLATLDPATEVPPTDLLPCHQRRPTPYLYAPTDIARLMQAAGTPASPLQAATYSTLIGLLAVTGLRISEAIRLDQGDVDSSSGLLRIIASKFDKSREVALHPSSLQALDTYARQRDQHYPQAAAGAFFVSTVGTRLLAANVRRTFARLVHLTGITPRSGRCRPTIHGMRHSFAVNTLIDWYRDDVDVHVRLPLLSTFLGHVDPGSTYWYLQAAPELLALAAQRLEHSLGELP